MELRRPTSADKATILDMIAEFEREESAMDGGIYSKGMDYEAWLEMNLASEIGLSLPEGRVPAIQFVSFDEKGQAIGFLNLRLRLNEFLLRVGGHIGYSIRPSQRGKGYAKEQLRLGLQEAKAKNIHRVLVTCKETNTASRRVILSCGGQKETAVSGIESYWIEVHHE